MLNVKLKGINKKTILLLIVALSTAKLSLAQHTSAACEALNADVLFRPNTNTEWQLYANGILTIDKILSKTTYTLYVNNTKFQWYWNVNNDGSTTSVSPMSFIADLFPEKYKNERMRLMMEGHNNSLRISVNGELHELVGNLELKTVVNNATPNSSCDAIEKRGLSKPGQRDNWITLY